MWKHSTEPGSGADSNKWKNGQHIDVNTGADLFLSLISN